MEETPWKKQNKAKLQFWALLVFAVIIGVSFWYSTPFSRAASTLSGFGYGSDDHGCSLYYATCELNVNGTTDNCTSLGSVRTCACRGGGDDSPAPSRWCPAGQVSSGGWSWGASTNGGGVPDVCDSDKNPANTGTYWQSEGIDPVTNLRNGVKSNNGNYLTNGYSLSTLQAINYLSPPSYRVITGISLSLSHDADADWVSLNCSTVPAVAPPALSGVSGGPTDINLSWDNRQANRYRVFRDGSQIAVVTGTSFTDTGRTPGTTYSYYVRAYYDGVSTDSRGYRQSNTINVTVPIINNPPSATNLSVTQGDYCSASSPPVILSWQFSDPDAGDSQSAYQVQVDNNSDFSSPEKDSGKVLSSSNSYAPTGLSYSTTYYWRVKVWDSKDSSSAWATGPSFTTLHAYPRPDFSWSPENPQVKQSVQFTDKSQAFEATITNWSWVFQDGDPATSSSQNPKIKFLSQGSKWVTLTVTDSTGYSCSIKKTVNVEEFSLWGWWKEIIPF